LHMAQLMPLPLTVSCFSEIQIGFTFLVPAHLGSPGKRAVKRPEKGPLNGCSSVVRVHTKVPSVLWHCWLGSRKGIRPVKKLSGGVLAWLSVCSRCRAAYSPADATATHRLCFSKIQIGFTSLVPAHLGSHGQRAVKWVCVCVCERERESPYYWY